jgi:hypothetical protein
MQRPTDTMIAATPNIFIGFSPATKTFSRQGLSVQRLFDEP